MSSYDKVFNDQKSRVTRKMLTSLEVRNDKTPDIQVLRMQQNIPVFVYGTLKQNFSNHVLLQGCDFFGTAHTVNNDFVMKDTGGFPVVFQRDSKDTNLIKGSIRGEFYGVSPEVMISLDRLENNGVMYKREMRLFVLEEQEETNPRQTVQHYQKGWIYLGVESYWDGVKIDSMGTVRNPTHPKYPKKSFFEYHPERGRQDNLITNPKKINGQSDLFSQSTRQEDVDIDDYSHYGDDWMQQYYNYMQ